VGVGWEGQGRSARDSIAFRRQRRRTNPRRWLQLASYPVLSSSLNCCPDAWLIKVVSSSSLVLVAFIYPSARKGLWQPLCRLLVLFLSSLTTWLAHSKKSCDVFKHPYFFESQQSSFKLSFLECTHPAYHHPFLLCSSSRGVAVAVIWLAVSTVCSIPIHLDYPVRRLCKSSSDREFREAGLSGSFWHTYVVSVCLMKLSVQLTCIENTVTCGFLLWPSLTHIRLSGRCCISQSKRTTSSTDISCRQFDSPFAIQNCPANLVHLTLAMTTLPANRVVERIQLFPNGIVAPLEDRLDPVAPNSSYPAVDKERNDGE